MTSPAVDNKTFDIIMDCTSYSSFSEIPMQWFKFFIELAPSDLRSRFSTAYILNCNLAMQRFLRKLYNICSGPFELNDLHCPTLTIATGIFFIEIRPKLSVSELCEAVHCNVADALKTACKR